MSNNTATPNIDALIKQLEAGHILTEEQFAKVSAAAILHLKTLPNVLRLSSPLFIVGDIHAQFYDLLEIFKIGGPLPYTNYLFLGNYAARGTYYFFFLNCDLFKLFLTFFTVTITGSHGVLVISLLLCYQLKYKNRIYLLRGHQDCSVMCQNYGYLDECQKLYKNSNVFTLTCQIFNTLPLVGIRCWPI